jgi:cytoskeletal protein CcmA (bactofilin family)
MRLFSVVCASAAVVLLASGAPAKMEFAGGQTVRVAATDSMDANFYGAAQRVSVDGSIAGDAVVAGQWVDVEGRVEDDVWAAAFEVIANGDIGGDLRAAGAVTIIRANVSGDLLLFGGQALIENQATVGGDAAVFCGEVGMLGSIAGRFCATGDSVYVNGAVAGDAKIEARSVVLGPKTVIGGALVYSSPSEIVMDSAAVVTGGIERLPWEERAEDFGAVLFGGFVGALIAKLMVFVIGLVAAVLFPRGMVAVSDAMTGRPLASLLYGFLAVILLPVVFIILMITVIGIPLGLIWFALYVVALPVARSVAAIMIGRLILKRQLTWEDGVRTGPMIGQLALGMLVLFLLGFIPVLSTLIAIAIILFGFGAIGIAVFRGLKRSMHGTPIAS